MPVQTEPKSKAAKEGARESNVSPEPTPNSKVTLETSPPPQNDPVAEPSDLSDEDRPNRGPASGDLPADPVAAEPPIPTDFVSEELPPDFWDDEPVNEAPSAQTRQPAATNPASSLNRTPPSKDAPLFDQLKQLFPGRVVRVEPLETPAVLGDEDLDETADDAAVQDTLFD